MTTADKNTWKSILPLFGTFAAIMAIQQVFGQGVMNMNWFAGLVLFGTFAAFQGFTEATTDYFKLLANKDYNGHALYRTATGIMLVSFSCWINWQSIVCYAFMFSFIHDGIYYMRRNNLDAKVYLKGFWDFTATPVAAFDKLGITKVVPRSIMFIVGVTILIIINYVNR